MTTIRTRLAWVAIASAVMLSAWISLHRLQQGKLFLVRLPIDRPPLEVEYGDAAVTARRWTLPALFFLAIVSLAIALTVRNGPVDAFHDMQGRLRKLSRKRPVLCALFALACVADFLSTLSYFHKYSLADELHPGIKLVTYAWGLSVGCLAAKLIQAALVLLVCATFSKIVRPVLIVTTVAYFTAAVWNLGLF